MAYQEQEIQSQVSSFNFIPNQPTNQIEKVFKINNKEYKYNGPDNTTIQILLQDMIDIETWQTQQSCVDLQGSLKKIEKKFVIFNYQTPFTFILITIVYWSAYFACIAESINAQDYKEIQANSTKLMIIQYMPLYCFLFTFCLQLSYYIKESYIWLMLFLFMIIIPLFVLLDYNLNVFNTYSDSTYDYQGMAFEILSMTIFVSALFNRLIVSWLQSTFSDLIASIMSIQFCLLLPYGIVFKLIVYLLYANTFKTSVIFESISDIIGAPLFFILFYISIFILYRLFKKQPDIIYEDLEIQKNIPIDPQYQSNQLDQWVSQNLLSNSKLRLVFFILFSLMYAAIMIYLFISFMSEFVATSIDYERIVTFGTLLILTPLFVVLGIGISNQKRPIIRQFLWIPLYIIILSIVTIKLWNVFETNTYLKSIAQIIGICPLILGYTWVTVGYFRSERITQKQIVTTFCCYFFVFPLGILLVLSTLEDNSSLSNTAYALIFIGLVPIALFLMYYIYYLFKILKKLPEQSNRLQFTNFEYYNLNNYATWYSSLCFMMSFFLICYFVWNEPSNSTGTKKGAMQGLLVLHPLLFILLNVALRQPSADPEFEISEEVQKKQNKLTLLSILCTILPFILFLTIGLIVSNEQQKNLFLSLAIGVPLVFFIFRVLIKIKNQSMEYQNFFQPLLIVIGWTCIIVPFGVIIPIIANYYENSSNEFAIFAQISIAFGLLICILGVTGTSLFFSILLNKEYLEQKKREVVPQVMQVYQEHLVSSDYALCSIMFMKYIRENDDTLYKEEMIKGNPVNVLEYNGTKKEQCNQVLVKKSVYDKFNNESTSDGDKPVLTNRRNIVRKLSFSQHIEVAIEAVATLAIDCFFCRCGIDDAEEAEKLKKQMDIELEKLEEEKEQNLEKLEQELKELKDLKELQKLQELKELKKLKEEKEQKLNYGKLRQPTDQYKNDNKRNDYYISLQAVPVKAEKVERLWAALYKKFQDDIALLLTYLEIYCSEEEYKQFKSYKKVENKIYLDENDFAELLIINIVEDQKTAFECLYMLSIKKFLLLMYNFEDLKTMLRIPLNQETVFSIKRFQSTVATDQKRRQKNQKIHISNKAELLQQEREALIEQEYEKKRQDIIAQYNISKSLFKVKIFEFCNFFNYWIWEAPVKCFKNTMDSIKSFITIAMQPKPITVKNMKLHPWKEIAEDASQTLIDGCKKFDESMSVKEFKFNVNITNCIALISKLYDLYGLATLAFSTQVGWFGSQTFDPISTVDGSAVFSSYNFYFFVALAMSIAYVLLGIAAVKEISANTFGLDQSGHPATYRSLSFYKSKLIIILSSQFIFIMKTYIDAFICDYTSYPYTMIRDSSIECMGELHFMYVILAFVGAFIYYPLSTFLQPTFQYGDHSLDLKYKSTFFVIFIQAKLLILGVSSVFSNLKDTTYPYQMLFAFMVTITLIIIYYNMNPCYVKVFNKIELTILIIIAYCYFGAFLIMITGMRIIGWIFLGIMSSCSILVVVYYIVKDMNLYKVQVQPKMEERKSIIQDL